MIDLRRAGRAVAGVALLLGAAALVPGGAAAASCSGEAHVVGLSGGKVSPGAGTKSTLLNFTVVYRDNGECFPDRIVLVVNGVGEMPLTKISGELVSGVTFGVAIRLPNGTWGYHFEAASGWGNGARTVIFDHVAPAVVRIGPENVAPTPTPEADPDPPWRRPTATPVAGGGAGSTGGWPGPTAGDIARSLVALPVTLAGTLVGLGLFLLLENRFVGIAPAGGSSSWVFSGAQATIGRSRSSRIRPPRRRSLRRSARVRPAPPRGAPLSPGHRSPSLGLRLPAWTAAG